MQPLPSRLARGGLHSLPRPSFQLAMPDSGNDGHASHASQKGSGGDCNPVACKAERNLAPNKGASAVIVQRHIFLGLFGWHWLALALADSIGQIVLPTIHSIAAYPAWKESRHITIMTFQHTRIQLSVASCIARLWSPLQRQTTFFNRGEANLTKPGTWGLFETKQVAVSARVHR